MIYVTCTVCARVCMCARVRVRVCVWWMYAYINTIYIRYIIDFWNKKEKQIIIPGTCRLASAQLEQHCCSCIRPRFDVIFVKHMHSIIYFIPAVAHSVLALLLLLLHHHHPQLQTTCVLVVNRRDIVLRWRIIALFFLFKTRPEVG